MDHVQEWALPKLLIQLVVDVFQEMHLISEHSFLSGAVIFNLLCNGVCYHLPYDEMALSVSQEAA